MDTRHAYAISFAIGAGVGFFLLTGGNTYGAGVWGNKFIGPFYSTGVMVGQKI